MKTVRSLVVALAACAPACERAPRQEAASAASHRSASETETLEPTPEERASHERMLVRLKEIVRTVDEENPYLGATAVQRLNEQLVVTPEGSADEARLRFELGQGLLRLGRIEEAIAELEACRNVVQALPEAERPDFAPRLAGSGLAAAWAEEAGSEPGGALARLAFELGVACMRLGSYRNCALHPTDESCVFPIRGRGVHADREGAEKAVQWFREALAGMPSGSPGHVSARWLLNVACMALGTWPDALSAEERIDSARITSEVPFPRFAQLGRETGVAGPNLAGGAACEDYDGDGLLDLVLSDWDPRSQLRFLHNSGKSGFEDRTDEAGLKGIGGAENVIHGDTDGDGRIDLFMLRGSWWNEHGKHPNSLLRNLGGRWVDVTHKAGLADPAAPTQAGAFADFDLDGDLDLYVANETSNKANVPGQLFRNEGNGTFTDVAVQAGCANERYAKGVAWGDYDGDRYPDLYVSNLGWRNRLYKNRGDGTFADVTKEVGVGRPVDSYACWFFDYDQDGALDLYVTGYPQALSYRLAPVAAGYLGLPQQGEPAALYRNDGRGDLVNVTEQVKLARISLPMGANFGDLDNDGYPDFYLGTGYPLYEGLMPNVMYWNRGGKAFAEVTEAGGFGNLQKGHGVVFADLDNDGDQDVFEEMGGAYPGDAFFNALYVNPGFGNHWLRVTLVGVRSERSGTGARIRATYREGDVKRSTHAVVSSGGSFGANPLTHHLGLRKAGRIDELSITWPATGETQTFRDVPVDVHLEVTEGADSYRVVPERSFQLGG